MMENGFENGFRISFFRNYLFRVFDFGESGEVFFSYKFRDLEIIKIIVFFKLVK